MKKVRPFWGRTWGGGVSGWRFWGMSASQRRAPRGGGSGWRFLGGTRASQRLAPRGAILILPWLWLFLCLWQWGRFVRRAWGGWLLPFPRRG